MNEQKGGTFGVVEWVIIAFAWLLLIAGDARGQAATQPVDGGPAARPAPPPLLIGVFAQHSRDLATWRARGVDVAIGHQRVGRPTDPMPVQDADLPVWEKRAAALGMAVIGKADTARLAEQLAQPHRLAFNLEDEPDMNDRPSAGNPGNVRQTPAQVQAAADAIRAAGGKTFCTFAGPKMDNDFYDGVRHEGNVPGHLAYLKAADINGCDYYLVGTGRPPGPRGPMPLKPGGFSFIYEKLMDRLHAWGEGRPFWLFVESGPLNIQNANRPGPTVEQFRYQALHAVYYAKLNGYNLAGICVFSVRERPWNPDTTPDDIAAAMPGIFAEAKRAWAGDYSAVAAPPAPPPAAELPADLARAVDGLRLQVLDGQRVTESLLNKVNDKLDAPLVRGAATQPQQVKP